MTTAAHALLRSKAIGNARAGTKPASRSVVPFTISVAIGSERSRNVNAAMTRSESPSRSSIAAAADRSVGARTLAAPAANAAPTSAPVARDGQPETDESKMSGAAAARAIPVATLSQANRTNETQISRRRQRRTCNSRSAVLAVAEASTLTP
jgi:hypothetical protein